MFIKVIFITGDLRVGKGMHERANRKSETVWIIVNVD